MHQPALAKARCQRRRRYDPFVQSDCAVGKRGTVCDLAFRPEHRGSGVDRRLKVRIQRRCKGPFKALGLNVFHNRPNVTGVGLSKETIKASQLSFERP